MSAPSSSKKKKLQKAYSVGIVLDGTIIQDITFASSADLAGSIDPGDQILAVDGESAHPDNIKGLLKGEVGSTVTITISRAHRGGIVEVPLKRRVWGQKLQSESLLFRLQSVVDSETFEAHRERLKVFCSSLAKNWEILRTDLQDQVETWCAQERALRLRLAEVNRRCEILESRLESGSQPGSRGRSGRKEAEAVARAEAKMVELREEMDRELGRIQMTHQQEVHDLERENERLEGALDKEEEIRMGLESHLELFEQRVHDLEDERDTQLVAAEELANEVSMLQRQLDAAMLTSPVKDTVERARWLQEENDALHEQLQDQSGQLAEAHQIHNETLWRLQSEARGLMDKLHDALSHLRRQAEDKEVTDHRVAQLEEQKELVERDNAALKRRLDRVLYANQLAAVVAHPTAYKRILHNVEDIQ